jgi:hypothetical protein
MGNHARPKQERKLSNMKNRNIQLTAMLFVVALAIAPIVQAKPYPDGGPSPNPEGPLVTIHSTDNVARGKIGTFVLNMNPTRRPGGMYVKFSVSGTAIQGVDYVALVSPAYIGQSGYGVIQVQTLADPRGSFSRQAYSVVITLEDGAGYALGQPSSATIWIKP